MHELSLVKNILNTLDEEFPDKSHEIRKIYLTVGLLSNIQPLLMQSAFSAVIEETPKYAKASLQVDILPIKILCPKCNKSSDIEKYVFKCNYCDEPCNNITQGDEMLITKIEFEE